jgi:hypothetical protein
MKLSKVIIILIISVLVVNCDNDPKEPTIILSNTNIAGSYSITSLNTEMKVTSVTQVGGVSVPLDVATASNNGDTFQIDFQLEENGSFKAIGQFRMISKVTPTIGNPETETVILDIDTSGTFDLDTTNNTIQFNVSFGDFLSGTFNITTFNETVLVLYQETEETEDPITTEMETTISFVRS